MMSLSYSMFTFLMLMMALDVLMQTASAGNEQEDQPDPKKPLIRAGDFVEWRELWGGEKGPMYMACSKFNQSLTLYNKIYDTFPDEQRVFPVSNANYVVTYDTPTNYIAYMEVMVCDAPAEDREKRNNRGLPNFKNENTANAFIHGKFMFINATHIADLDCIKKGKTAEQGNITQEDCPANLIRTKLDTNVISDATLVNINDCFKDSNIFCSFKTDANGDYNGELAYFDQQIIHHRFDLTMYYVPYGYRRNHVYIHDHMYNATYYVPQNITTFGGANPMSTEIKPWLRIPLFNKDDPFVKTRRNAVSTTTSQTITRPNTQTETTTPPTTTTMLVAEVTEATNFMPTSTNMSTLKPDVNVSTVTVDQNMKAVPATGENVTANGVKCITDLLIGLASLVTLLLLSNA